MSDPLTKMLGSKRTLLADGATGTHIREIAKQEAIELPAAQELLNLERPELVRRHHRAYLQAGSEIVLTNSWAANRYALADEHVHLSPDEIYQVNRAAALLLKEEIAAAGPAVCAGSVGPTGWLVASPVEDGHPYHGHEISYADAVSAFADQIRGLVDGGVEVIWIETQIGPHEARAAIEASNLVGAAVGRVLPFVVSMVFNRHERTQEEYDLAHFADEFGRGADRPAAFGINCGHGPEVALELVARNPEFWQGAAPLLLKPNCGSPLHVGGRFQPKGLSPGQMGRYAQLASDYGVSIVGACCGSTPAHIEAMRDALQGYSPGPPLPASRIHADIERAQ
ncbi:5-methyltetrahydrofolate--homocysteine methyltransferase [Allocatelliglobosispora scoriae]|uniref:5-methyltetrahydrofolate--homocysteine methyltransferase n=1 Tax=Allocatelliglobosispora scoriae TaxID=643052 RepID=A0A841BLJ9_9ACTN|nr:homocysteine S-methyltransferase family protein [Allocatelliglobosispora scoriae]MBB5867853.1 5-methyltetrahydrofolate--homocysteine methyltransferase [Allocatelliglobosispora scoriae]